MPRKPVVTALTLAALAAGTLAGCTPAPSGWLDAAPLHEPSHQPSPPAPVTDLPTFDDSTAVSGYAEGFPQDLVPVPPGATLIATSCEPADGLLRISLNASSAHGTDEVLGEIGTPLATAGFVQTAPDTTSGLTALTAWTRRTDRPGGPLVETVLVGILDDGERRLVTVSGTVQATQG